MLYDTEQSGRHAVEILDALRDAAAAVVGLPWCTESLMQIEARCRAWDDLARADYIILALSRSSALPESVQQWISTVLDTPRVGGVTVFVSLDSADVWAVHLEERERSAVRVPGIRLAPAPDESSPLAVVLPWVESAARARKRIVA